MNLAPNKILQWQMLKFKKPFTQAQQEYGLLSPYFRKDLSAWIFRQKLPLNLILN